MILKTFALFVITALAEILGCYLPYLGGVYVSAAVGWMWLAEKQIPTRRDLLGVAICLAGMLVIASGSRAAAPD